MSEDVTDLISVVFPCWNEEENIDALYEKVTNAMQEVSHPYELVFVDNGSTDSSLEKIKSLREKDSRVWFVSLSRNFLYQGGLFAGLSHSRGAAVITMDADLQHPPELIPEMVRQWERGHEVVFTTKRNYDLPFFRGLQVKLFYWLISRISGLKLSFGQSDFRLLDRKVVDVLLKIPESRKFLRGLVDWVGFRQTGLEYDVAERYAGESKFSFGSLFALALDGILSFSFVPLRCSIVLGTGIALLCFLYAIYIAVLGMLMLANANVSMPPGWATLTTAVMFLASVQLIAIGTLSEYVGRIHEQTKGRPVFIVREVAEPDGDEVHVDG